MSISRRQRGMGPARGCFHPHPWAVLPPTSAGLRLGFGKEEGDRFRVPPAEPFLCSEEAAVHMFYIPSSRSLHSSVTFGFYYYSTLEIPQLK